MTALIIIGLAAHRLWAIWHWGEITRQPREWCARVKDDPQRSRVLRLIAFHGWCEFCTSISAGLLGTLLWPSLSWPYVPVYALAAGVVVWTVERGLVALNAVGTIPHIAQTALLVRSNGVEATR